MCAELAPKGIAVVGKIMGAGVDRVRKLHGFASNITGGAGGREKVVTLINALYPLIYR